VMQSVKGIYGGDIYSGTTEILTTNCSPK